MRVSLPARGPSGLGKRGGLPARDRESLLSQLDNPARYGYMKLTNYFCVSSLVLVIAVPSCTGAPSVRIDRSPRITCSEPSIGVQDRLPAGSVREARHAAVGDFDPFAVADARLDLGPHRLAVLVPPVERLVAAIGEGGQRQRPDAWALDDHLGVGVHPGQDLAAGVGQVDLGTERAALDVQRPGRARDGARDRLVAVMP